ncbi:hypothetical protein V7127_02595 [Bacillus sp. JJ1773]|uniref:phage tail protein n=1 Tax=Bacillus sp. JJ1773 TaxID=3122965 RepID=UPI002FFEE2FE
MSNIRNYQIAFQIGANLNSSMRTAFANANRTLSNTNRNAGQLNAQARLLGRTFGSLKGVVLGLGGAIAGAFAVKQIIDFGKKMIETTAELQAVQEQYDQVMGSMKATSDLYLKQMGDKWNKHPGELQSTLMQYYAILKGKGVEEKKAYELAQNYLERSVDANMFANESMADTTARFMAMIKGEYSSVDTAMVNMNVTLLNTKALEKYKKKWDKLTVTEQEVLKTQEALRQHTAAGVFGQGEREAQSYANNVAMLKNTWEELLAKFGTPLLPIVNDRLKQIIGVVKKIDVEKVIAGFSKFKKLLPDISRVSEGFKIVKNVVANTFNRIKPVISNAISIIKPILSQAVSSVRGFIGKIQAFWNKDGAKIISGFRVVFSKISTIVATVISVIAPILLDAVSFIKGILGQIGAFWNENGTQIIQAVKNVFGFIAKVVQVMAPVVLFILKSVWANVKGVIQGALNIILGLVKVFSSLFTGDWAGIWIGVKKLFGGAIQFLWNLWNLIMVGKLVGTIKTIAKAFVNFFKGLGQKIITNVQYYYHLMADGFYKIAGSIFKTIFKAIMNVIGVVRNGVNTFMQVFNMARTFGVNVFMSIVSAVRNVFSLAFGAIKSTFSNIVGSVKGNFQAIWAFLQNLWSNIINLFQKLQIAMATPFQTLSTIVSSVVSSIKGLITGLFQGVTNAGKVAINALIMAANAMIGGINKLNVKVPDWVPGAGGKSIGFNIPKIPMLAAGGITTGPTLAMIGEGAEQEAVLPLSKLNSLLNSPTNNNNQTQIIYSPNIIIQGNATKSEVEAAQQKGQQDFDRWYRNFQAEKERLTF